MLKIYTLGSPGSYGDQVRRTLPKSQAVYVPTNAGIVQQVVENNGIGIIPVSNPYGGQVSESWEALETNRKNLVIAGSHELMLDHVLIQRKNDVGKKIERIFSHPQAHKQSEVALRRSHGAYTFAPTSSTTEGPGKIQDPTDAAICSATALTLDPELSALYQIVEEKISPADNATIFIVIATRESIGEIMHLPASEIDIVRIALQDKPAQHAMKTLLVNLLGFNAKTWQLGNIHEWDNKKTTPGVSPLYSELLIASRLRRGVIAKWLMARYGVQLIPHKEDIVIDKV